MGSEMCIRDRANGQWKGEERVTCFISWSKAYKDAIKAKEASTLEDFLG